MTRQEIKQAIKETRQQLKTARGVDYIRLTEDMETLLFLYVRCKK